MSEELKGKLYYLENKNAMNYVKEDYSLDIEVIEYKV